LKNNNRSENSQSSEISLDTGNNSFTGTAFRAVTAYFYLWLYRIFLWIRGGRLHRLCDSNTYCLDMCSIQLWSVSKVDLRYDCFVTVKNKMFVYNNDKGNHPF